MRDLRTKFVVLFERRCISSCSAPQATRAQAEALARQLRADPLVREGTVKVWRCDKLAEVGR